MNNAALIVEILKAAGIGPGFGIPSGNVLPLIEAMRAGGIGYVLVAHEGSAGFAADVAARLTGRPGLCLATLGPGATNLATGVGGAYLDRSPMIAITCNLNADQIGRRIQMGIDHHALFRPITKASLALQPGAIGPTLQRAIALALAEPQGPVHLDIAEDVVVAPAGEPVPPPAAPPPAGPAPDPALVAEAGRMLAAARRPIAVIGAAAMRMAEPDRLRAFIERNGLPFASTTMAKGMVDEDHALSVGCIERGRRQIQRRFLAGADLVVGLGYDTIEVEYEAWIGAVPLVAIDIEPVDAAPSVDLRCAVVGDLDQALDGLNRLAPAANDWPAAEIAAHRGAFQTALRPPTAAFGPHQAIDVVRDLLPRDGILTFDVGAHTHQIAGQWTAHAPKTFLITNGWSSMGFGLPAAIAAKLARPDLPVVCILGDGCFQMTCGELAVANRLGLTLPVVVLNDRWLSLIQLKQEKRQFALVGSELQSDPYGTPPPHYFGVPAVAATDGQELARALEAALAAPGPTVIETTVDPAHYMETVFD